MKKSNSINQKIKLLSIVISTLMVIVMASLFIILFFNEKRIEFKNAIKIYENYEVNKKLQSDDYYLLSDIDEIKYVKKYAKNLLLDDDMIKMFALGKIHVLTYNNHYYIHLREYDVILKSRYKTSSILLSVGLFLLLISILLYGLLYYIKKTFLPLNVLHQKFIKFGKGDFDVDTRIDAQDEIALLGNTFYKALQSIKELENNRKLFIRNIMHELKTPLTRNNLILHSLGEKKFQIKDKLLNNNNQINNILETINQFDSLQNEQLQLNKEMFNLIDLVDEAIEKSDLEKYIDLDILSTSKQKVDFNRFVLVLKNLIINAHLHSKNRAVKIAINSDFIRVSNTTEDAQALDYTQIKQLFYKNDNQSSGMGLGLYIVDSILKMHDLNLEYEYSNILHEHSFTILFETTKR